MNIVAALALVPGLYGASLWMHERARRLASWMIALAAAGLAVGVPVWLGTLAAFTASTNATIILGALTAAVTAAFWLQAIHKPSMRRFIPGVAPDLKDHYHRVWTMVVALAAGTLGAVTWARLDALAKVAKQSPALVGGAFSQARAEMRCGAFAQVRAKARCGVPAQVRAEMGSGHAVSASQQKTTLLAVAVIVVVLILLMRRHAARGDAGASRNILPRFRRGSAGRRNSGGGRGQIPGGGRGLPPGAGQHPGLPAGGMGDYR
jgi:hypothetical protein